MPNPNPLTDRPYAAGHYVLTIDGCTDDKGPAYLKECGGGLASASLVTAPTGTDPLKSKHISTIEMQPIDIKLSAAASKGLLQWVDEWWQRKALPRNGMIVHADTDLRAQLEHEFYDAELTELAIPAVDANSKDAMWIGAKFHPRSSELKKASGYVIENTNQKMHKQWSPANYLFQIQGLEDACRWVSKIDALTVKQKIKPIPMGNKGRQGRTPELIRGGIEFPNINIYLPLKFADVFLDWHKEFHIKGAKAPQMEKEGTLSFLDHDLSTTLFAINFNRMGILKFEIEKAEANAKNVKRAKIELYCENWSLDYSGTGFTAI